MISPSSRTRGRPSARSFVSDTAGGMLVYAALATSVLVGMVGLAVDGGSLYGLSTELQQAADAAALAGAAELNGGAKARENAESKARTLLSNRTVFSATTAIGISEVTFYSGLICSGTNPTDATASCIKVKTESKTLTTRLLQVVGVAPASQSASAMAESRYVACSITPLMLCTSNTIKIADKKGRQYRLADTNAGAWFGLVNPPGDTTGQAAAKNLAAGTPNFCFTTGMSPAPGNKTGQTDDGLNVRFDIYPNGNPYGGLLSPTNASPPAPNTISGFDKAYPSGKGGGNCGNAKWMGGPATYPDKSAYPRDANLVTNAAAFEGNSDVGAPTWDRTAYAQANYTVGSVGYNAAIAAPTRYDLYLTELGKTADENGTLTTAQIAARPANTMPGGTAGKDLPAPKCYKNGNVSTTAYPVNRRVIYVAVVDNCLGAGNADYSALLSAKYAKMFVTEASQGGTIYAEFIKFLAPNDSDSKLRQVVQLVQ